jgi:hypothetical protein
MTSWITFAQVAAGLNLLMLAALGGIWLRNYLELRSRQTLGMVVFTALLFVENGFAVYYYLIDPELSAWFSSAAVPDVAWHAMLLFHVLELLAIGFLLWVTLD